MRRLRILGALALLAAVALGGCSRNETRPSGIAERWLQAVSDRGRHGLQEDAAERIERYGTVTAADSLTPPDAEDDERTFSDLEVGKAQLDDNAAIVPFRVTARIDGDERREITGVLQLTKVEDTWKVVQVLPAGPDDKVPSRGGERPARARLSQWAIAIIAGLVMTVGSVVLIERQSTPARR